MVPLVCLQVVIVVFPDHTQLLFMAQINSRIALGSYAEKKVVLYGTRLCLHSLAGFQWQTLKQAVLNQL